MTDHGASPEEREIFRVALARMSDECTPPDLIAECPFSIDIPGGGRGCGAECEDILRKSPPARLPGELTLSDQGMTARRRPDPPQRTTTQGRPFDATEVYYRESENSAPTGWSPVALLVSLRRILSTHPDERTASQDDELRACFAEIGRRGIDPDALCRRGLAEIVVTSIVSDVAVKTLEGTATTGDVPDPRVELRDQMFHARDALKDPEISVIPTLGGEDEHAKVVFTVAGDFFQHLVHWSIAASPEDLFAWRATADIPALKPVDRSAAIVAQWLFDRFTQTFLSDWSPDSLKHEWRFHKGETFPVSEGLMAARRVDAFELTTHLADLATDRSAEQLRRNISLVKSAVRMLETGRRDAAAAMFDAVRQTDRDDPDLQNNYGFCLIPDKPRTALAALEAARRLGKKDAINRANRALTLARLDRSAAALEVLEAAFEVWPDLDTDPAYLWAIEPASDPQLVRECPRCYLVKLGAWIARDSGDVALGDRWTRRVEKLTHVPT